MIMIMLIMVPVMLTMTTELPLVEIVTVVMMMLITVLIINFFINPDEWQQVCFFAIQFIRMSDLQLFQRKVGK